MNGGTKIKKILRWQIEHLYNCKKTTLVLKNILTKLRILNRGEL
jgi:hypothetical protein